MEYSKPKVTIDLDEYNHLVECKKELYTEKCYSEGLKNYLDFFKKQVEEHFKVKIHINNDEEVAKLEFLSTEIKWQP